jgi:hypothetical protein
VPEVHVYVTKPQDKDVPALEDVDNALRRLSHVSEAKAYPTYSMVSVSFKGGRNEEAEIERTIEETGYEISRLSGREGFAGE